MSAPDDLLPRPGEALDDVVTPRPVIDEDRMAANIGRVQAYMDAHGLRFRPHVKTHKIPAVARAQVAAGAVGINCQKVTEAEAFAAAGFDDILITYNVLGSARLDRLAALHERAPGLKVVADSAHTVAGLSARFAGATRPLPVLVECDTGGGRCGVQGPDAAVALARVVAGSPGLLFGGLVTYPRVGGAAETEAFLAAAVADLGEAGLPCPVVSNAGTPSLFDAHRVPSATEHRAGTYVFNDRAMVRAGHCAEADCAMEVLTTVVSRPTPTRAVVDAGSKTLTSDLLGFPDYGLVVGLPGASVTGLSEEHGVIDLSGCAGPLPEVGDRLRIVPNHTCVVANLFDHLVFHRAGVVTRVEAVAARGCVW